MSDVSYCSECGAGEDDLLTEFGADLMLDYYYTDFYCQECGYAGRVYRMEFGPEVFRTMNERGVEPAIPEIADSLLADNTPKQDIDEQWEESTED